MLNLKIHPLVGSRPDEQQQLLQRPVFNNDGVGKSVSRILERVRSGGDAALAALTLELDGVEPQAFTISQDALEAALESADPALVDAIGDASERIRVFHAADMPQPRTVETAPGSDLRGSLPAACHRLACTSPAAARRWFPPS